MGSSSSSGSEDCCSFFLSGDATSKTLFPMLSWKFALGSTGSGLGVGASFKKLPRPPPYGLVGLTFSLLAALDAGPQVFRLLGATNGGGWTSGLLFLRAKGLFWKKPFFCWTVISSGACG